jgi:hypothetical protein
MDAGSSASLIGIRGKCLNRPFVEARAPALLLTLATVLVLAVAGCGGDDEEQAATSTGPAEPPTATEPAEPPTATTPTATAREPAPAPTEPEAPTSPEDQPGGAGDEEGAYTLALFTGEGGRITPAVVRVPAYISIRVELRSGDGRRYRLTFEGEGIGVGGGLGSVSTTIDALRPGEAVVGIPEGARNRVRIEATAEPGP